MSFAGVSAISEGKLLGADTSPIFNTRAASGYHLLVVQGYSLNRGPILSHSFTIGCQRWRIHYMPFRKHGDSVGFITLFLSLVETTEEPVKAHFKFRFVDDTDVQEPARIHGSTVSDFPPGKMGMEIIKREALEKHLQDDSFTIRCDIVVLNPTCNTSQFIDVPPSDMQRNFTDLLLAGEGTDVAFRVGGETVAAHRCVLAARSTVFRAALFGPMKEGTSTVVQVDDMNAAVFKALLAFIYGDTLPAVEDESEGEYVPLLQHLLAAADRYDLRRLRLLCEKKLCEYIDVGTVTTILPLAEQHGSDGLKKACYQFLRCPANLRAVVATDGFAQLCKTCPPVMTEMILGMLPPN